MTKDLIKAALVLFGLFCICFIISIIYIATNEYKPQPIEMIAQQDVGAAIQDTVSLRLITWNIGYCGMDSSMDFFFDGGKKVRGHKNNGASNYGNIMGQLVNSDSLDYLLLQEVDKDSKRSFNINQVDSIKKQLSDWYPSFAINYDVLFIPYPYQNPLGKVVSGIMTLSKDTPVEVQRISLPGSFSWPKKLVMPKRCLLVNRYKLSNGKELVIINIHNSAFDKGTLKKLELSFIKQTAELEYSNGNYVIMGGDWNELPPNFTATFTEYKFVGSFTEIIAPDFFDPKWKWAYDNKIPTNRNANKPFNKDISTTLVIDYYLLSPNIELIEVKTIDFGFINSDHNPVYLKVKLKT